MIIRVILYSIGSNAGPLFDLYYSPGGVVPFANNVPGALLMGGGQIYTVPDGTEKIIIKSVQANGYDPGLCADYELDVIPLGFTTTTTTTGGVVPPSPTTTTTTTSGGIPPTTTTTTSSSTSSTTTTTTTSGGTPPTTTTTTTGGQPEPPTTTTTTTELPFVDQSFCWTLHIPVDVLTSGTDVLWAYRQLEGQQNSWVQLMYTDPPVEGYVYACICSVGEPMYGYAPNGGPAPAQTQDIMSIEPTNTCNHCTGDGECGSCWELEDLCTTSTTSSTSSTTTTTTTVERTEDLTLDQNYADGTYTFSLNSVTPVAQQIDVTINIDIWEVQGVTPHGDNPWTLIFTIPIGATTASSTIDKTPSEPCVWTVADVSVTSMLPDIATVSYSASIIYP